MTIIFQIIYKTVNIKNLSFQQKVGRMIPYPSESVAPYHKWQPCNSLNLYNFEYKNCFSSVVKVWNHIIENTVILLRQSNWFWNGLQVIDIFNKHNTCKNMHLRCNITWNQYCMILYTKYSRINHFAGWACRPMKKTLSLSLQNTVFYMT